MNTNKTIILTLDDTEIKAPCYECSKDFDNCHHMILHYLTDYGIISLHLECWLPFLFTLSYERIIKMSNKDTTPKPANINDVMDTNKGWDYTHSEVLDNEIVVNAFTEIETGYGNALLADCTVQGEQVKVLIGGVFLIQALQNVKDKLPVSATITKEGKYYRFK